MNDGIQLFDAKGRMLPLDQIEPQLTDDNARERFAAVKSAYELSAQTDGTLAAAQDHVKDLMADLAVATDYLKKFPKRTFFDEWKSVVKGQ